MKVKALTFFSSVSEGNVSARQIIDVTEQRAKELCGMGVAEAVAVPKAPAKPVIAKPVGALKTKAKAKVKAAK